MAYPTARWKHDLLWATCIVAGFAVAFGLVVITRHDWATHGEDARLLAEVNQAVAEGDLACSDAYADYAGARRAYMRAVDLLRSAAAGLSDQEAVVRLKMAQAALKQQDYRQARADIERLQHFYPTFSPELVASLHREVTVHLGDSPAAPSPPDGAP